ncbi:FUSC family protein [Enterococcus wangshanyuanii]|uniref:FUSC family protein n=1 Tax=Enterococcus wangshanyuanii TaxID=2005703 RepID=A0ABQ1NII8_9ENTE|nr:aromatic acid exporter family protein [Enterococcus wangshanyuanii]GGC78023.1 FUSC family protein [Enterococcus wangshanyuanii]
MKFKIGMRTFKTGISVFLCILVSILLKRETYVVAAITTVFSLREDMENTLKYGKHRITGNVMGAIMSVVVIAVFSVFGRTEIVQLIFIPTIIMVMIALLASISCHEGTVGACATLLTIVFMIPSDQSYGYAFARVIDSFIGMGIALAVNYFIPLKLNRKKAVIPEDNEVAAE